MVELLNALGNLLSEDVQTDVETKRKANEAIRKLLETITEQPKTPIDFIEKNILEEWINGEVNT